MSGVSKITFISTYNSELVIGKNVKHIFPPHLHRTFNMGVITKGKATLYLYKKNYVLNNGDIFFIKPFTTHSIKPTGNEYSYIVICHSEPFSKCINKEYSKSDNDDLFNTVIKFLDKNLENNLSISDIADAVNLSKYYFSRIFKEETGLTPYDYYMQMKVKKVKLLLRNNLDLVELAYKMGFYDQSHLNKCFKKHVGITPGEYKKVYQEI